MNPTYLLVRPLPRWALYLTKLLATLLMTTVLATVFTIAAYAAIYLGEAEPGFAMVVSRALRASMLLTLALIAYCSLLGCLSFYVRRTLLVGVAYIALFERRAGQHRLRRPPAHRHVLLPRAQCPLARSGEPA